MQITKMNKIILLALILMMSLALVGCPDNTINTTTSNTENTQTSSDNENPTTPSDTQNNNDLTDATEQLDINDLPIVTLTIKDMGTIEIVLLPKVAPNTVNNFIELVRDGFYDGLIFHRVIKDFMIQGGDPTGSGMGGPGYSIKGEFTSNDFDNPISHTAGVISMARSNHPDSAGSQFFIVHKDSEFLDGQYAAFGIVIEGMEVVNAIAEVKTDASDRPESEVVIESATVELNNYEAKPVEKIME